MSIIIDKGVPIPSQFGPNKGELLSVALNMDVGDSFSVPDGSISTTLAGTWSKRHAPKKFIGRKQPDGTRRIWRVA